VARPVFFTITEIDMATGVARARDRTVLFLTTPALWPCWPFLPLVRRTNGREELGVVFDARSVCGETGFSACVFLTNVFALPSTLDAFFSLPREMYDTADELFDNGWRVD
jgi:hypothetical protein